MTGSIRYEFSDRMWQHPSPGGWYFVSLPESVSKEIRDNLKWQEEGWGRMKVLARTGGLEWETAIWFDTKHRTYLLPVKAAIRKKADLSTHRETEFEIRV